MQSLALACALAAVLLVHCAMPALSQEAPPVHREVSKKFGYSFESRGLTRLPTQPDVTLLEAFVDKQPGSFLEVEWLRPRDHSEYLKVLTKGNAIIDLVPEKQSEEVLGGRKFAHVVYRSEGKDQDTKAAIWIEKAERDQWFFGITVFGTVKDFDVLRKAAVSFSTDMSKVPATPARTNWVDKRFGFHIDLQGFKNEPSPWTEAILDVWSLHDEERHYGTFIIKLVRPRTDEAFEQFLTRVRQLQASNDRTILSDEAVERGHLSGRRMKIEFEQDSSKHRHEYLFLWDDGQIWQVAAAWRPAEAQAKEADLIFAVDKFMPTPQEKAEQSTPE